MKKKKKVREIPSAKRIKKPDNAWYKKPEYKVLIICAIITATGAIIAAIIMAPWFSDLLKHSQEESQSDTYNNQQLGTETFQTVSTSKLGPVRGLEPLETGKKLGDLPNGIYFFAHPLAIEYELNKPNYDFLEASSQDQHSSYEIQKVENRYYLIGFISDEAYSKIGSISEDSIYTILFPNSWGGTKNLVAIPFDAVYTIKVRSINLDEVKTVDIFDIGFKEVVENPELHKIKEL